MDTIGEMISLIKKQKLFHKNREKPIYHQDTKTPSEANILILTNFKPTSPRDFLGVLVPWW